MTKRCFIEEATNGGFVISESLNPILATDDLERVLAFVREKFGPKQASPVAIDPMSLMPIPKAWVDDTDPHKAAAEVLS